MNTIKLLGVSLLLYCATGIIAQSNVGINMGQSPDRLLEFWDYDESYLRIQCTTELGIAGLELTRGTGQNNALDWRITNTALGLSIQSSSDDFMSDPMTRMHLNEYGYLGVGTIQPLSRLHIVGTEPANLTDDGFLMTGSKNGQSLAFDFNHITGRTGTSDGWVMIQPDGGSTKFGNLGTTNVLVPNGRLRTANIPQNPPGLLSIGDSDQFGMVLINDADGTENTWRISATGNNWAVGPDQLIFTPTASSSGSVMRLMDATDNDGTNSPVIINSAPTQKMLIDGNEIDAMSGPLYINHNSNHDIFLNPSGGKVGIGTAAPVGMLHIKTDLDALGIERGSRHWEISVQASDDISFWNADYGIVAMVDISAGGDWVALSDSTRKKDIQPVKDAMSKVSQIDITTYEFSGDDSHKRHIGVIAQDLEKVMPEAVNVQDGQYAVMYDQLTALALAGVKEQQTEIDNLLLLCDRLKGKK